MTKSEDLFKGQCMHCNYLATNESFTLCCDELIKHLQQEHADELHKIYEHALNRAVLQGMSCVE